jgi:hypothetical protein
VRDELNIWHRHVILCQGREMQTGAITSRPLSEPGLLERTFQAQDIHNLCSSHVAHQPAESQG